MTCQQCKRCIACMVQRAVQNESSCIRLIPGQRSEALSRNQSCCTGSSIVFRCGCR